MAIITLTTDWGERDFYAGSVKGKLLSQLPDVRIVDITHQVEPFNIAEAGFILKNAFHDFPAGSVHLVAINSLASKDTPHIVARLEGHYFVTADNGILSLLSSQKADQLIEIDIPQDSDYFVFPTRDLFVKAAIHLLKGNPIGELGFPVEQKKEVAMWESSIEKSADTGHEIITGRVIYIDNYGNCITNISVDEFQKTGRNRPFYVHLPAHSIKQDKLFDAYDKEDEGKMLALTSTTGQVEIAINQGRADTLLGLKAFESTVIIEFTD